MMRATRPNELGPSSTTARAFTLIELLVVILIILIVSAVALPTVLSGIRQRQIGEAARVFHAAIAGARDAAIANNAPRGIRLLPDPTLTDPPIGTNTAGSRTWAFNRFIPIEPGPDYREGRAAIYRAWNNDVAYAQYYQTTTLPSYGPNVLCVIQSYTADTSGLVPVEMTSWAWNLRVGDKIQFVPEGNSNQSAGAGHIYTIVGPVFESNPEGFINYPADGPPLPNITPAPVAAPEFLLLVNGVDDDTDGFVDPAFDGVDNNNNNKIDMMDGLELSGEAEKWLGAQATAAVSSKMRYVVKRRPIPARGARETFLPSNVVIDLTTWNSTQERSRLPISADEISRSFDLLIDPSGQVIQSTSYSSPSASISPFLHFWFTDREGVVAPPTDTAGNPNLTTVAAGVLLPMPEGTPGYATAIQGNSNTPFLRTPASPQYLRGERMLITLFARTGDVSISSLQNFNDPITGLPNINAPFYAAQQGIKESP